MTLILPIYWLWSPGLASKFRQPECRARDYNTETGLFKAVPGRPVRQVERLCEGIIYYWSSSTISYLEVISEAGFSIAETLQYFVSESSTAWATALGSMPRPRTR